MTKTQLLARIDDLLTICRGSEDATFHAFNGTLTLMITLYGRDSPLVEALSGY